MTSTTTANSVVLRSPSKYASATSTSSTFSNPPLEWLHRTWTVTHSTLSMWRSSRNVRITYTPLPPATTNSSPRVDDLVEYEKSSGKSGVKTVAGIDTAVSASDTGSWNWRGKGLLMLITSHWEILGWGERGDETWAVTWFAPTLFTKEGLDIYSSRREGMSPELAGEVLTALKAMEVRSVAEMVEKDMREVEIKMPWQER